MTGIQSKERYLADIEYWARRAKEPHIKKRYTMKQLGDVWRAMQLLVRTEKCLGL